MRKLILGITCYLYVRNLLSSRLASKGTALRAAPVLRTGTCYGSTLCIVSVGLPLTEFYNGSSMYIVVVASHPLRIELHCTCAVTRLHTKFTLSIYHSITRLFTYPPIKQAINLSTHPFIYLPIYLPTS